MRFCSHLQWGVLLFAMGIAWGAARADASDLSGHWVVSPELTREAQPDGPQQKSGMFEKLPNATISVGGMPIPGTGSAALPSAPGTARDPRVLRAGSLTIEELDDSLHLNFGESGSETLKRGNDQGLVSRWSRRKLTTRYETSSRKVSQSYEVRRDGTLLVTVKLNPRDSAAVVHRRVFQRPAPDTATDPATSPKDAES